MTDRICGIEWSDIERAQQGGTIRRDTVKIDHAKDYGYDHIGERAGFVRMVPSGDVLPLADAVARLSR